MDKSPNEFNGRTGIYNVYFFKSLTLGGCICLYVWVFELRINQEGESELSTACFV